MFLEIYRTKPTMETYIATLKVQAGYFAKNISITTASAM